MQWRNVPGLGGFRLYNIKHRLLCSHCALVTTAPKLLLSNSSTPSWGHCGTCMFCCWTRFCLNRRLYNLKLDSNSPALKYERLLEVYLCIFHGDYLKYVSIFHGDYLKYVSVYSTETTWSMSLCIPQRLLEVSLCVFHRDYLKYLCVFHRDYLKYISLYIP